KIANARLFEDDNNKLNFNIQQMNGEILSVSQFTLYADVKKGTRPGFSNSKNPDQAVKIYEYFNDAFRAYGLTEESGEYGSHRTVSIINERQDGKIQ
ncbi:D-aminoacyl-tRNA deacylase, partial [Staphylococcus aureus]|uniref:D-aminoacyl-tRNA deacylase n=1 Tax=Staphylococcus aureus TaxID=1280 RepID=UPI000AA3AAE6